MFGDFNADRVPVYLKAKSKENLIKMMHAVQMINSKNYNFQTPMKEGSEWVVWFFADLKSDQLIAESEIKKIVTVIGTVNDYGEIK
jgi:hypothetical protein